MKATLLLLLSTTLGRSRPRTAHPAPVSAVWRGFAARIVLLFVFAAPAFADSSTGGTPSSAAESLAEPNPHAEGAESAEPVPAPVENHAEGAESAEPVPTPVENHAEGAESAEPVPTPVENHAEGAESAEPVPAQAEKPAKSDLNLGVMEKCGQVGFVDNGGGQPRCGGPRKAAGGAAKPGRRAALQSRARLSDGSILKGTLRRRFLPADTDALGRVRIDLAKVERIDFIPPDSPAGSSAGGARSGRREGAHGAAEPGRGAPSQGRIAFRNGDRLTVRFPDDLRFLPFNTLLGRVRLPLRAVSSLAIASDETDALIYHCTFDSASSIEHPAAGPAGRFLRGSFVPGKNGKALRVEADTPAFETKLPKGFLGPEGCLEFWAKIEGDNPRYVDGGDPLFVSFYDERGAITLLQFAANNGFARGGLGGAFVSWPFGTIPHYAWSMEYRKVLGENWADWHHYAMSWKAGGFGDGSFVKVFVDGKPQPVLGGVDDDKLPARLADYASHAHDLGIPWSTARADRRRSKKPFLVDDLKIWSVAKTDFALSTTQPPNHRTTQPPKLLYHCTFDDAQSIENPAAGPAGKFLGGEFVPGKKGRALLVKAGTHAAEVPFPTGLMQPQGCIEFWGKIPGATKESSFPDGGNPQFFAMGVGKWVNTFVKYTSNDGMGTGGLHADLPGSAYVSTLPSWSGSARYPDFLGDPSAWHHYALVWSEKGLDAASEALGRRVVSALYVDGRLVNPAYGTNGPDRAKFLSEFVDNPVILAFPIVPGRQVEWQNRVDYMIDEFKIWNFPKTDFPVFNVQPPKLLYHCTFDDGAAIEHPAAGPTGTFLGGEFVPGKKGNALRIPGNVPTALVDLPRGMMQPRGTIEFWSRIEDPPASYGDRGNPRFFGLSLFDDPANPGPYSTYLQFTSNDGMGMSGLCGMIYHRAMATDPHMRTNTYGPILKDPAAWHHYAIVWDSDGLSFSKASDGTPAVAAIVLDGRVLQTFGRNQFAHGKGLLRLPELQGKLAFPVADTGWGFFPRPVAFLIDEFKIWSAPKTDFAIPPAAAEPPRLLYHCTFDDAAAIERPAAGPSGTFLGGTFEEGKAGNALRVRKGLSSAIVHFEKGVLQPRGMIEFWAKIENDREHFGDGGDPRFFMMETAPGSETVFQLAANDGCGRGGLSIYHQGLSAASEDHCLGPARYDSVVPGATKGWHHYALVWDENGVPGPDGPVVLAAFIDGRRIPLHGDTGLAKAPRMASRFRDNPATFFFSLNPELDRGFNNKSDFLIDEFKIWSAPKTDFPRR